MGVGEVTTEDEEEKPSPCGSKKEKGGGDSVEGKLVSVRRQRPRCVSGSHVASGTGKGSR